MNDNWSSNTNNNCNPSWHNGVNVNANTNTTASNSGSGSGSNFGPPNGGNGEIPRRKFVLSEKALTLAVQRNSNLYRGLVKHMSDAKTSTVRRREQIMQDHQRRIDRMKIELAAYEQRAAQEKNYWNTQYGRLENGIASGLQVLRHLCEVARAIRTQGASMLLQDMAIPDYTWLDSLLGQLGQDTENMEAWKKLKTSILYWNAAISRIATQNQNLHIMAPPPTSASNVAAYSPILHSSLQNTTNCPNLNTPSTIQYVQNPQSAALINNPSAVPNVSVLPNQNDARYVNAMPTPSTSASCAQGYSSNQRQHNYILPNYPNPVQMQDQLIRELLTQPTQPDTVVELSHTQLTLSRNSVAPTQAQASTYVQQNQQSVQRVQPQTINELRVQRQRLLNFREALDLNRRRQEELQLRLQQQQQQQHFASAHQDGQALLTHHVMCDPPQQTNTNPRTEKQPHSEHPAHRRLSREGEGVIMRRRSSDADRNSDDGCVVLEEEDPLADTSTNQNSPGIPAPLLNQNEIRALSKAQRLGRHCDALFEEETTEVIHIESESPPLAVANAITPPYSDLSDQDSSHLPPANSASNRMHLSQMFSNQNDAAVNQLSEPTNGCTRPQVISLKRNSTGSVNGSNAKKPKQIDGEDGCHAQGRRKSTDTGGSTGGVHMSTNSLQQPRTEPSFVNAATSKIIQHSQNVHASNASSGSTKLQVRSQSGAWKMNSQSAQDQIQGIIKTFEDLKLDVRLVNGLKGIGFERLKPIQKLGFPPFLNKRELLVVSEMCSGKTTMGLIGLLHKLNNEERNGYNLGSNSTSSIQAIIITSSMKCGASIKEQFNKLSSFLPRTNSNGHFKAVCTNDSVFGNGHVLIGDPPAMKTFFALQQQQADQFNKTRNIKSIVIDNAEIMKEEFFSIIIGITYSSYIRGDAQVVVLTRTMEVPGFSFLRKTLRNPELIIMPLHPRQESTSKQARVQPEPSKSPPVMSIPERRAPAPMTEFRIEDARATPSPPVISIPDTGTQGPTPTIKFFVTEATSESNQRCVTSNSTRNELLDSAITTNLEPSASAVKEGQSPSNNETEDTGLTGAAADLHFTTPTTIVTEAEEVDPLPCAPTSIVIEAREEADTSPSAPTITATEAGKEADLLDQPPSAPTIKATEIETPSIETPVLSSPPSPPSVAAPTDTETDDLTSPLESLSINHTESVSPPTLVDAEAVEVETDNHTPPIELLLDSPPSQRPPSAVEVDPCNSLLLQSPPPPDTVEDSPSVIPIPPDEALSPLKEEPLPRNFHQFQHFYCEANDLFDRVETVNALATTIMLGQAYMFCKTTNCNLLLANLAGNENLLCKALDHSNSRSQQLDLINAFQNGELKALILTDETALEYESHLKKVPFVLNFDCPENPNVYVKRSSFATFKDSDKFVDMDPDDEHGNAIVLSFVGGVNELNLLREIETKYKIAIDDATGQDDE